MRKHIRPMVAMLFGALPLALSGLTPGIAAALTPTDTTVVVTAADLDSTSSSPAVVRADGLNKWFMYNDSNDTVDNTLGSFVLGPNTPPHGTGSVSFTLAASPNDRKNIATYQFAGKKLSDITVMKYAAYSQGGVAGPNESPYLNFNVDFVGSNAWQKRLVYAPSANMASVPQNAWNTFDAINSGAALWTWSGYVSNGNKWPDNNTSQYRTWADIVAAFPSASVLSTDSWLGVRVGEPGPNGYTGAVDSFTLGTAAGATTFDFEKVRQASGQIVKPAENHHYTKTLKLKATYDDGGAVGSAAVNWAIRQGTCAPNTATVFGNVDGRTDAFAWDGTTFTATLDIRAFNDGSYCFVFNPTESAGQQDVRLTRTFYVDQYVPEDKDDCKNNGWKSYVNPSFKNQGKCISYVEQHNHHHHYWWHSFGHRH